MQTPYFLPTEPILAAMQTAALSGVDIRLMLPERADNWITHLGSRSYLADVMQAGVKVYFYKKGFLHSKLMVSDDMLSTVGSTNVDFRSFEHNFEVNAFMYDVETALEMKEIFLQDQRESTQIFLEELGQTFVETKMLRSLSCVYWLRCFNKDEIVFGSYLNSEKFTLPYTLLSRKCGFLRNYYHFPCSSTNNPPSLRRLF